MAGFYQRHLMPRLIACACGSPAIMRQRARIVPRARGRVLELGAGGGLNFRFYAPGFVSEVVGVDPSAELRAGAEAAPRPEGLQVTLQDGVAESLPFEAASFDTVVCTFTLCSVRAPGVALAEAQRVLRPAGRLLFCEHGLSPDPDVALWQRRLEPNWKPLAGGCHLTRPVSSTLKASRLRVEALEGRYLRRAPKVLGWVEWGEARAD